MTSLSSLQAAASPDRHGRTIAAHRPAPLSGELPRKARLSGSAQQKSPEFRRTQGFFLHGAGNGNRTHLLSLEG